MSSQPLTCDDAGYDFPHWWGWCPVCRAEKDRSKSLRIEEDKVHELRRANDLREYLDSVPTGYKPHPSPAPAPAYTQKRAQGRGVIPIDD